MCSWALLTGIGSPNLVGGPPTKNPTSSSKSISLLGPKQGGVSGHKKDNLIFQEPVMAHSIILPLSLTRYYTNK